MDPAIRHWVEAWDDLDQRFWQFVSWARVHLSPGELAWQPCPEVASIGFNLVHLAEMLDYYLHVVFLPNSNPVRPPLRTMERNARDTGTHTDLGETIAYHRVVRPRYRQFLTSLTLSDFDRPLFGGRRSLGWAVAHIHEHESYHLGKCMLLRTLIRSRVDR